MMFRTWIESINTLFDMGKDLESEVDGMKGGIVADVSLTEVDKHYTLTITYEDGTSSVVNWDDSTVGIEDITMTYNDGVYLLTIILTDGTRYTFSIPVGNVVTEEELQDAVDTINATITAMNVGSPDDEASTTGSLWARMKNVVARITTNENNISILQTADTNNVKKTGTSVVTGDIQVPSPSGDTSVINKGWANDATDGVNNVVHKTGNEMIDGIKTFKGAYIPLLYNDVYTNIPASNQYRGIRLVDKNGVPMLVMAYIMRSNGTLDVDVGTNTNSNGDVGALRVSFALNGTLTLSLMKTVNGVSTSSVIATL